jgi:NADH:ubiquinone oxidoreductase subunit 3 (subunit A)
METIGTAWIQFYVSFYVYALVFVVFDVETVFLYPWAVAYGRLGLFALGEMLVFIAVLAVALVYAWKKQALRWW